MLHQLIQSYDSRHLAIELAVIWIFVFIIFRFLQGTRGAGVIRGFAIMLVVATVTVKILGEASDAFTRLNFLYDRFIGLVAILLIVVFQPELRQAMSRLGHAMAFRGAGGSVDSVVGAVSQAVEFLSKSQFGALIAIERNSRLGELVESGTQLDARVDARLLESIFWPNSPLHDLGVVIRGDRILAASVQFPLAEEGALSTKYGSRHRAAAGLSLESDCLVVIVSEETGAIGIAEHGRIAHDLPRDRFAQILAERLGASPGDGPEGEPAPEPGKITDAGDETPDEKQAA